MFLGEQMKESETLQNEYKEFCIKKSVFNYYSQEELNYIIETGKLDKTFNNMIIDNIKLYCDIYVPKYASAFTNSNVKGGNIQIGVNDHGEVTGIPFYGKLYENHITKLVENAKKNYLLDTVITKVKVIKLKYHEQLICDNSEEFIMKNTKHNKIYKMILDNYYFERQKWVKEVLKYSVKLSDIVKNEYTQIKFYIWLKNRKCHMYNEIIQKTAKEIESIQNKRQLITNQKSIIHWIALYKDETMEKLQAMKPENPNITKFYNSSFCLMTQLTEMREKFHKNNRNINYYNINIYFEYSKNKNVKYKKINSENIYKSYREEKGDLGPYSITYVS